MNKTIRNIIVCIAGVAVIAVATAGITLFSNSAVEGTIEERLNAAEQLLNEGRRAKAENTYKSVLEENGGNKDASLALADMYFADGEHERAIMCILNALGSAPKDEELYNKLMGIYRESGDVLGAFTYIANTSDYELREKRYEAAYDRKSPANIGAGNTMGNLSCGGKFAFTDDAIYYADAANYYALTVLRDGKSELLCEDSVESLNISGEYLYFIDKADGGIHRMKLDGSQNTRIGDAMASHLIVLGQRMYYIDWTDENHVYSARLDGSDTKRITGTSTNWIYAYRDKLYINDRDNIQGLKSVKLDGSGEYIWNDHVACFLTGFGDNIYYQNGSDKSSVYLMKPDGESVPINDAYSECINAGGGYLFFIDYHDNGSIIRSNWDGSEQVKLCSDKATDLSIDGEYIYYFSSANGKKLFRIKMDGTGREQLN